MTSKGALEIWKCWCINENGSDEEYITELKNIKKKDLEVLEIIKKWSFIQENYKDGFGKFTQFLCNIHTIGMEEDFKKVKEWLENDNWRVGRKRNRDSL